MFNDTVYKISLNTDFINEKEDIFTWGVNVSEHILPEDISIKLNNGLKQIGPPWKMGVPYFNNGIFVFISKNALCTFLFDLCNFTNEDLETLNAFGYKLYELKISVISTGYSKMQGLIFTDEILNQTENNISTFDYTNYERIGIETISFPDANSCKRLHYDNHKFKIYFK